jgi:hypothetical protein
MFWWRIKNREVTCAACPLALGAQDSGTPIIAFNIYHIANFLQTPPPKTTTQESWIKTMISMDQKGFGLEALV